MQGSSLEVVQKNAKNVLNENAQFLNFLGISEEFFVIKHAIFFRNELRT